MSVVRSSQNSSPATKLSSQKESIWQRVKEKCEQVEEKAENYFHAAVHYFEEIPFVQHEEQLISDLSKDGKKLWNDMKVCGQDVLHTMETELKPILTTDLKNTALHALDDVFAGNYGQLKQDIVVGLEQGGKDILKSAEDCGKFELGTDNGKQMIGDVIQAVQDGRSLFPWSEHDVNLRRA